MTTESVRLAWPKGIAAEFADACKSAGERPVEACVSFLREAAALLEPGFAIPAERTTVCEPAEVGRGDHNGSYYYEGSFREGDAGRFVAIDTSYNRPEEMMYPETHSWHWHYVVGGLADGRKLELRCWRDEWAGGTTGVSATLDVTGPAVACAAVVAAFRAAFQV